jgi:hypothetical protein
MNGSSMRCDRERRREHRRKRETPEIASAEPLRRTREPRLLTSTAY